MKLLLHQKRIASSFTFFMAKKPLSVRLEEEKIDLLKTEAEKRNMTQEAILVEGLRILSSGELEFLQKRVQEKDEMIQFLQNQYSINLEAPVVVSSKMEKEKSILLTKLSQKTNIPKGKILDQMLNDPNIIKIFFENAKPKDLPQLEKSEPENPQLIA